MPERGEVAVGELPELSPAPDVKRDVACLLKQRFLNLLREKTGSLLQGWRTELDPDLTLYASREDVLRAAAALRLEGAEVAAQVLLNQFGSCGGLSLLELSSEAGVLLCRFRRFVGQFGSMRKFLDQLPARELKQQDFATFCRRHGFVAPPEDLAELFGLFSGGKDVLQSEDLLVLEPDTSTRRKEAARQKQLKLTGEAAHRAFLVEAYKEEQGRGISCRHRLAPRPWHDKDFEALPEVICRRNQSWFQEKKSKSAEVRGFFLEYIRKLYGSEVRAWRRALDPDATFQLTLASFKRWAKTQAQLRECADLPTLWRSLDRDGSGCLSLEELAPLPAAVLAQFRQWMQGRLGSCSAVWEHEEVQRVFDGQNGGLWVSRTKLLTHSFAKVVKRLGWRHISDPATRAALFSSLDYFGCGFLSRCDLEWLDAWSPPEWLFSEPDPKAWAEIRGLIMSRYRFPLAAWRALLDKDDSNSVSWDEFKEACWKVGYRGPVGGAWRALDHDLSGTITLREFDAPSAKILISFKVWCDLRFGSLKLLFKSMDADNNGSVSFAELCRACKKGGFKGDARMLFNCLDIDQRYESGKRSVELEELLFLDSWDPLEDEPLEEAAAEAEAAVRGRSSILVKQSFSTPVLPKLV